MRHLFCKCRQLRIFIPARNGACTSQHLFDPYSLVHIDHGFLGIALFYMIKSWWVIPLVLLIELIWELIENSQYIIQKYRQTVAPDYEGDSWVNSIGDLICCLAGAWFGYYVGPFYSLLMFLTLEFLSALSIKASTLIDAIALIGKPKWLIRWQQS